MENKENYNIVLSSLDISKEESISFYNNLTSTNVISIEDVNNLASDIKFCIEALSSIYTDQFCQFCQNTKDYYIQLTDDTFPRVKYYNDITTSISAVFSNSTINNIALSSLSSINLISYSEDEKYNIVSSINGHNGRLKGIEKITINGNTFAYNETNKGIINLGNYKTDADEIVYSINGLNGTLENQPEGIKTATIKSPCNENGFLDASLMFSNYLSEKYPSFNYLYVNNVDTNNLCSIINLKYVNEQNSSLKIKKKDVYITSVENGLSAVTVPSLTLDGNFLSFVYGIQNGQFKRIEKYTEDADNSLYAQKYYQKGIPLTFVITEENNTTFRFKIVSDHNEGGTAASNLQTPTLFYSLNYKPYQTFNLQTGVEVVAGDVLALSGTTEYFSYDDYNWYHIAWTSGNGTYCKPNYICFGNIMSLVNWDTEIKTNWQFYALFSGTNIIKAPQLPAMSLKDNCYDSLFQECTKLIVPPLLPATTLFTACYRDMFSGCTSLSAIPLIPAMTLAPSCCYRMFDSCASLTILPYYAFPAMTLKQSCYESMFANCTSLTDSPLFPATDMVPACYNCYKHLFSGCTALTAIHMDASGGYLRNDWGNGAGNYAQDFTLGVHGATMYNTQQWNDWKDDPEFNRGERYYYDSSTADWTDDNWGRGNNNPISKIARALKDTPLSFELVSSHNDSGRICWRFYAAVFKDNALSGYKKFSFKHTGNDTLNAEHSGYVKDFVKPSATVYAGKDQPKTDSHAQRIKYKTVPTLEWFAFGDKFHHGKDESNNYITIWCQYKTTSDSTTFWELNPDHQGSILSFKSEQASYGFLTGDTTNGILPFLNLRLKNNIKIRVMGNIMSLAGWRDYLRPYQFYGLFKQTSLKSTNNSHSTTGYFDFHQMVLPATTLAEGCYEEMFEGCSGIIQGPINLPATIATPSCYMNMFKGCKSLINMPYINATTLYADSCHSMFADCSSLVFTTPFNNFQSISPHCCEEMFGYCTNIKYFPDITVNVINQKSFYKMFTSCPALKYPPSLQSNTVNLHGCAYMFAGCPIVTAPAITITTISNNSFEQMFQGCTKIQHCYLNFNPIAVYGCQYMFKDCTKLSSLVVKFDTWGNNTDTYNWVQGVSANGKFYCSTDLDTTLRGIHYIPNGWTIENNTKTSKLVFKDTISIGDMTLFYLTK